MNTYRVEAWYEDPHLSPEDRVVRHVQAMGVCHAASLIEQEMKVSLPEGNPFRVTSVVEQS